MVACAAAACVAPAPLRANATRRPRRACSTRCTGLSAGADAGAVSAAPPPLAVRRAEVGDISACAVTVARSFAGAPEAQPLAALKVFLSAALANDCTDVLLAEVDGVAAGVVVVGYTAEGFIGTNRALDDSDSLLPPQPHSDAAYLSNMAVAPKHRRKGIGRTLVLAAADSAAARGCSKLYLHVRVGDEPASALYEGCGFVHRDEDALGPVALFGARRRRALLVRELAHQ